MGEGWGRGAWNVLTAQNGGSMGLARRLHQKEIKQNQKQWGCHSLNKLPPKVGKQFGLKQKDTKQENSTLIYLLALNLEPRHVSVAGPPFTGDVAQDSGTGVLGNRQQTCV